LLEELRRAVPFDAYAWLLTDPETEVGASPVADVPSLADLPRLIRLKYETDVNRWTHLQRPTALLSKVTEGDLARSLIWRELLDAYGVVDVASTVFRDKFGCWAFLDLWRIGKTPPFHEEEANFLEAVASQITSAIRRVTAETFRPDPSPPPPSGPVVLMLTSDLEVKAQTSDTEKYLRLLVPTEEDRPAVPAAAYNIGAQLIASEAGVDEHPAMARAHLSGGVWMTLRAARMGGTSPLRETDIAVTIERSSPTERLGVFARASGLSRRETELVQHLATGADTRGVAQKMFVSENTVQDHLKAIFDKTGIRSRSALLATATGIGG
jgi:DNA-binding NarL/FixJ family response regulator